jgi:hypothetical protein
MAIPSPLVCCNLNQWMMDPHRIITLYRHSHRRQAAVLQPCGVKKMTNRLMTSAAILAFVYATAILSPAFAQDDGTGEDVGGVVTIDDGVLNDGDTPVEGGDPVPYGPDDCIDCNVAPTMVDDGGRPVGENFRGDVDPVTEAFSRSEGGSDDSDEICDHTKMGNAAKVCP